MSQPPRIVIIGGGFGGLYAARSLRRAPVRVTLIDRRNFHLFQPLLYQVATAALSPANIAAPLRYVLKRQSNANVLLGDVSDIDVERRVVILRDGEVPYDTLIVAAGSQHNYFGHDSWADHAPGLKTLEDATRIRGQILYAFERAERETDPAARRAWLTFVLVGAGPTGVEMAGSVGEIARDTLRHEFRSIHTEATRILLVDIVDRVLPTYPPDLSASAARALERLGVNVVTRTSVTEIERGRIRVKRDGREESIESRTIIWTAGVQASPLGARLAERTGNALKKGGRLAVLPELTLPGRPEISVIGDMAECLGPDGNPLPGIAPVAMQQGHYAAKRIVQQLEGRTLPPFRYRHRGDMATIGRAAAVANFGWIRFHGFFAWLAWLFIHLLYIVEFEDRLLVLTQWAWNYFTRNRGARLITGR